MDYVISNAWLPAYSLSITPIGTIKVEFEENIFENLIYKICLINQYINTMITDAMEH